MTNRRTEEQKATGRAYAFFDCDASKEEIEGEIPGIRGYVKTSKRLEMVLHEGISGLQFDERLSEQLQHPDDYRVMLSARKRQPYEPEERPLASLKYVLVASGQGISNERVASELGDVMSGIHYTLDKDPSLFRGAVIYEKEGEYQMHN